MFVWRHMRAHPFKYKQQNTYTYSNRSGQMPTYVCIYLLKGTQSFQCYLSAPLQLFLYDRRTNCINSKMQVCRRRCTQTGRFRYGQMDINIEVSRQNTIEKKSRRNFKYYLEDTDFGRQTQTHADRCRWVDVDVGRQVSRCRCTQLGRRPIRADVDIGSY